MGEWLFSIQISLGFPPATFCIRGTVTLLFILLNSCSLCLLISVYWITHSNIFLLSFRQASVFPKLLYHLPTVEWSLGLQFPGIPKHLLLYLLAVAVRSWSHKPTLLLSLVLELRDIPPTHPAVSVYVLGGRGPCSTTEIMHRASPSLGLLSGWACVIWMFRTIYHRKLYVFKCSLPSL